MRRSTVVMTAALVLMALVTVLSVLRSYSFVREQRRQIYVIDKGKSILALQSDGSAKGPGGDGSCDTLS